MHLDKQIQMHVAFGHKNPNAFGYRNPNAFGFVHPNATCIWIQKSKCMLRLDFKCIFIKKSKCGSVTMAQVDFRTFHTNEKIDYST